MPLHILIIDDEANQRLMLAEALRTIEPTCAITTVEGSQAALEFASQAQPDLIITDYNMPDCNGIELITRLRARQIKARIILITAYSTPDLRRAASELDIDHYLTKPIPLDELRRTTLAVLLPERQAA